MDTIASRKQDVPPALALIGLVAVLGALLFLNAPQQLAFWQSQLDRYVDLNLGFLAVVTLSFSLNAIAIVSFVSNFFGINQQGSRLALLSRRRAHPEKYALVPWKSAILASMTGVFIYFCLSKFEFPGQKELYPLPLPVTVAETIVLLLRASFAVTGAILLVMIGRFAPWSLIKRRFIRNLSPFPKINNGIVLGSTGEDDSDKSPEWATMNRRALNGNIIVTGSIGTGKTQGTILTFFDQILSNFKPTPSVLAIDPKGTFIPEALKIIKKHGLENQVLHMRLGGNVTFNPVLTSSPLKEAQFLDTTQMIRAAAMNFIGRSSDSGFWETLAFNLKKNCLAYCAAKQRGVPFTLNDIYREMILACQDALKVADELLELSKQGSFDSEESYNLLCASNYFREFDQFDQKVKTGVLATATSFLNQFQEYRASQVFCPKPEDTVIKSMDEVVDQGKILLFDISSPALARSMGTFVKLHYEQSVLNRLVATHRGKERTAVIIADEYQDVVSTGGGAAIGDDRFCAKSREANAIALFASQSLTSLKNSIGKEDSAKELFQNFRTMIAGHSTDLMTIHYFQELMGKEEFKRVSHSISENAHHPSRNLILGGFEAKDANISESISTTEQKEYSVTGKEFATLSSFECFARIYDGNQTSFKKLYLKPYFLEKKNTPHSKILSTLKSAACLTGILIPLVTCLTEKPVHAFPNVCTVVKTPEFRSCLNFSIGACMCGWPVPRPCAQFSYYVPETFVEVFPDPKSSYFGDLPGAAVQLGTLGSSPYGAESDTDTQSFQAHTITVPLTMIPFALLPCGISQIDRTCFGSMSEHLGSQWQNGSGDSLQPNFLAWSLSPKACLLKGAASSISGEPGAPGLPAVPSCSVPMSFIPKYPPSSHSACNGWGVFYPRSGVYNGPSQVAGALMVASRMKSLGNEIFHTTPSSIDEAWQMVTPQSSSCFKEGQNVGILETVKNVREEKRLMNGKTSGFLFTVWNKVSCCRDLAEIPTALAAIEAMNVTCQGLGAL